MNLLKFLSSRALQISLLTCMASPVAAWQISSRELVDMQFAADDSLTVLVSAPGAPEPGIYRWLQHAQEPSLLCKVLSPASFSFDRKTIIERVAGQPTRLHLYDPSTCHTRALIAIEAKVIDVDVRGHFIAVAVRLEDLSTELRVYNFNGQQLGRTPIGRNVEMGFAPDGRSVVNFDLSDGGSAMWNVPKLSHQTLPAWFAVGETTFVPGSLLVKRYVNGALMVALWPSGTRAYSIPSSRSARLRQLSVTGRFGLLHSLDDAGESLEWLDLSTKKRAHLASGSVDNAAINRSGNLAAWALRSAATRQLVQIYVAPVSSAAATGH